jgi:uncharacterized protein YjiS (DUF1127 family)
MTSTSPYAANSRLTRPGIGRALQWGLMVFRTLVDRSRQRRALAALDDRLLRDVGMTRALAERERQQREHDRLFWTL